MSSELTLGAICTQVLNRTDFYNSNFIGGNSPPGIPGGYELRDMVNASAQELYDVLRQKFSSRYFINSPDGYAFTTTAGQSWVQLPSDFLVLVGVDWQVYQGRYISLRQQMPQERNRLPFGNWSYAFNMSNCDVEYEIRGNYLVFTPIPNAAFNCRMFYIPQLPLLATDGSADGYTFGQILAPYYEYIVIDCCIKVLQKAERDISFWAQQKMAMLQRVEEAAAIRNLSEPDRAFSWYDVSVGESLPWGI